MKPVILILFLFITTSNALSLEEALKQASQSFTIDEQQLIIKQAQLSLKKIQQSQDYQLSFQSQLGLRQSLEQQEDDHRLYFYLNKTLFDNDQNAKLAVSQTELDIQTKQLSHLQKLHRFNVIQTFFDGVLADLEYDYLTQILALSAVGYNYAQDDFEFGYISEVELVGKQTQTQLDFTRRLKVEHKQINHRNKLASLFRKPKERPDKLSYPKLKKYLDYQAKNEDEWYQLVNKYNIVLQILQQEITALKNQKNHYKKHRQWTLNGYTQLGEQTYNKEKEGNYRFGIKLNIPLNNNHREDELKTITLEIQQKQLELSKQSDELNTEILALFLTFQHLKQQHFALIKQKQYLQFSLDKASLEYEMRLSRNIGNAMILVTKNDFDLAKTSFALALTLEKLNLLTQGYAL